MVIIIDKTTTEEELNAWLEKVRDKRKKGAKPRMAKYFGALPDIGDGLLIQKQLREEW
ncbi:hypothetical protein FACS1894181_14120 [Bacteroidia bacterium]|nr:hypothetical protein FACS1894181_14120 [Bacteroidia bacterium]